MADKVPVTDVTDNSEIEFDRDDENRSPEEQISYIKSSLTKLESSVVAREAKLTREMKFLKEENELVKGKMEETRMEKLDIENELKKYKKRCGELLQANSQLREEQHITCERERNAEDRCKQLLEEMKRKNEEASAVINALRIENGELASAKRKAESQAKILRKEFEELQPRVRKVLEEAEFRFNMERKFGVTGDSLESSKKLSARDRVEKIYLGRAKSFPNPKGSGRPPPGSIIEIIDSDDEHTPKESSSRRERTCGEKSNELTSQDHKVKSVMDMAHANEKIDMSGSCSSSLDSEDYKNRNSRRWYFEIDMITSLHNDDELCLEAVCALFRRHTSLRKQPRSFSSSKNQGFGQIDEYRGTTLAEFLTDRDPQGKLKKSVSELRQSDPNGLDDCRIIALHHSKQLFDIYRKKEDSFFIS